ncbi:Hypothetical protein SMAX5B_016290 [Scophthalmus maximus]|uniref:Uncharacterized protein n=1 Tax=Scophthalmus maximus TaxID=52904 RepID=A0A2U9BL60_SCOMX|nr:Hypothetical protein SMAX5B_016290 [Scophthalmus maximus]
MICNAHERRSEFCGSPSGGNRDTQVKFHTFVTGHPPQWVRDAAVKDVVTYTYHVFHYTSELGARNDVTSELPELIAFQLHVWSEVETQWMPQGKPFLLLPFKSTTTPEQIHPPTKNGRRRQKMQKDTDIHYAALDAANHH